MFNFFGFKKRPDIEDVEVKVPLPEAVEVRLEPLANDAQTEVLDQMKTADQATREDVIAAYKIFLGRLPESMEVVDPRVGVAPAALLVDFLASKEFLDQTPKAQLVLAVAKKIIDARQSAQPAEVATTAPSQTVDPASPSN